MAHTFSIPVLACPDGTLSVVDSDITGLVVEVNSFDELLIELPRVAGRLLRSNHKLTDEEVAESELQLKIVPFAEPIDKAKSKPRHSLPNVYWLNKEPSHSLEYAS